MLLAGNLNFKLRIAFWNIFFGDLEIYKNESHFLKKSHLYQYFNYFCILAACSDPFVEFNDTNCYFVSDDWAQYDDAKTVCQLLQSDLYIPPKGQIISKQLLVSSDSSKKRNERIRFFRLTVLKTNLLVRFLEESEDTKKPFRNYLTFRILTLLDFRKNKICQHQLWISWNKRSIKWSCGSGIFLAQLWVARQ